MADWRIERPLVSILNLWVALDAEGMTLVGTYFDEGRNYYSALKR